ncbi:MAG: hypothetical protein AAGJ08_28170 [Cyanobacteria bacterium P01_H01_bin.35]
MRHVCAAFPIRKRINAQATSVRSQEEWVIYRRPEEELSLNFSAIVNQNLNFLQL